METMMAILLIAGLSLLLLLIRFAVHRAADKAGDAVRNACVRSRQQKNPPQYQRLSDRFAPAETEYGTRD